MGKRGTAMKIVAPDAAGFAAARDALRNDEVVAYPTETVYGLGVNPFSEHALEALYRVKGRDPGNPVLVVIGSQEQLSAFTENIGERARQCMERFWPGPLSLVFPAKKRVPAGVQNETGGVCVRWSSHPVASGLALAFGSGITSTSANRSGQEPATTAQGVPSEGVSICIDGGNCVGGRVSTVFDPESNRILREGAVSRAELDAALGNS